MNTSKNRASFITKDNGCSGGCWKKFKSNLNMWEVARPLETYIKENLGPKAVVRDIAESAKAIVKFGPHAPYLIEKSLRNALDFKPPKSHKRRLPALIGGVLGLVLV